ncbi:uncharacterized protein LOC131857617 [Cryptomeria japonica]|uniref:uncharacterized protein LOC131857617 n=1 Tax=Cryptomeria japonica TaxID=3369 RepID=UPI0027DA0D43|nr:uncharacterized protein LOC131857617 [Cryptomeria japonica]
MSVLGLQENSLEQTEVWKRADVLDNLDHRCIGQSTNILLGKAKGNQGRRSNKQTREARANEKGIINVIKFMKKAKGVRVSLEARGSAGGLGVLWNPHNIKVMELERTKNWLFGVVHSLKENVFFPLVNVYGPIKTEEKAKVWKDISDKIGSLNNDRVIVEGDFNALLDLEEKRGGLKMNNKVMEYFRDFVTLNHLFDVIPKNGRYTLTNRRENFAKILERLDRFLMVKKKIKELNKVSFKNIFVEKIRVEVELDKLNNNVISVGMSNDEFARDKQLKRELSELLLREEVFWWDKSRECWIKEGDLNTKIFHSSVKVKRANSRISRI